MTGRFLPFTLTAAFLAAFAPQAGSTQTAPSAQFNITPIRLELPDGEQATQMVIRNRDQRSLTVQMRVFRWEQVDGADRFIPTDDVVVSPGIIRIAPESAQTFHVVARTPGSGDGERQFRVVVDQLPDSDQVLEGAAQTRVRMTVPLFEGRERASEGQLAIQASPGKLHIANSGGRTVRLAGLAATDGVVTGDLKPVGTLGYVFGGSWIEIDLPPGMACSGAPLHVTGTADGETFDVVADQVCP